MQGEILSSGRDALLVGIPLILILFIGLFRLDELLLRRKKVPVRHAPRVIAERKGPSFACDPDGTPLRPAHRPKKSA